MSWAFSSKEKKTKQNKNDKKIPEKKKKPHCQVVSPEVRLATQVKTNIIWPHITCHLPLVKEQLFRSSLNSIQNHGMGVSWALSSKQEKNKTKMIKKYQKRKKNIFSKTPLPGCKP